MMDTAMKKLRVKKRSREKHKDLEFLEMVNNPDLDFLRIFKENTNITKYRKLI